MTTKADICNLALATLGERQTVASITPPDGSPRAGDCARWYPVALKAILEEHDWSFATTKVVPVQFADLDTETWGWSYAYAVPADCVKVSALTDAASSLRRPLRFEKSFYKNGEAIFCNSSKPILTYVAYVDHPSRYPSYFIQALATLLAAYLVGPVRREDSASQVSLRLMQAYREQLALAKSRDSENSVSRHPHYFASQLAARRI